MHAIYQIQSKGIPFDGNFYQPGYANVITGDTIQRSTPDSFFADIENKQEFQLWIEAIVTKSPIQLSSNVDIFNFITSQPLVYLNNHAFYVCNQPDSCFTTVYWDGVSGLQIEESSRKILRILHNTIDEFFIYYDKNIIQGIKITEYTNRGQISQHLLHNVNSKIIQLTQQFNKQQTQSTLNNLILHINTLLSPHHFTTIQKIVKITNLIDPDMLDENSCICGKSQMAIDLAVYLAVQEKERIFSEDILDVSVLQELIDNEQEIENQIQQIDSQRKEFEQIRVDARKERAVDKFLQYMLEM
ncbi:hypothetical protein SS50377_26020 [Spironucleus salmonicida]|uniref:Uncharacterized protein n=1 Tax=Spironucleus salmonicida TaxID=348837 RepID=V6LTX4_9EUKA|nr:hypothetical protein SS50377_26020 [Spironucleus salmonicida]|eukprot:EST48117.1 Hypothetical protein SS50377_11741 [Spironucleus salmonicida]